MTVQRHPWRCRLCERSNVAEALACEACGYEAPFAKRVAGESAGTDAGKAGASGWLARLSAFFRR